jgi:hypothetical protein
LRDNGAIFDGARGFSPNDRVVVLGKMQTAQLGRELIDDVKIIGHEEGIKKCSYNYIIVRASLSELLPFLDVCGVTGDQDETEHLEVSGELCIVYDVAGKQMAKIVDPDSEAGDLLEFPCYTEKLYGIMEYVETKGVDLFTLQPQGATEIQHASGIPNWQTDIKGDHIRGGASPKDWWTTYDTEANPVQNLFEELCFAVMLDDEGANSGRFDKVEEILSKNDGFIKACQSRSPAFRVDEREYQVEALSPDGFPVQTAKSKNIQTAYGEDEVWMCAVNSIQGIIVSYCDAKWKFIRMEEMPPNIGIPGVIDNWIEVANDAAIGQALPGGMSGAGTLGDLSTAMASEITLAGKGGENSIWSWALFKRVNEGCFHRTTHPAISGSFLLETTEIPEDYTGEPKHLSAINKRYEKIDAWYRYDNWQNTWNYMSGSFGVDVTNWMVSTAQQFGSEAVLIDCPLGSMYLQPFSIKGVVWHMMSLSTSIYTARREIFLNQNFINKAKHSRNVCTQIYLVHRTSLTVWAEEDDVLVIYEQTAMNPFDSLPNKDIDVTKKKKGFRVGKTKIQSAHIGIQEVWSEDSSPINYVKMPDNSKKHISLLTEEEIKGVLGEATIIHSGVETQNINENSNQIEILASADIYGDLFLEHKRKNPVDQVRDVNFEAAIGLLVEKVMSEAVGLYERLKLDMEII